MLWKWSKKEQKISVSSFLMCLIMQAIIFITVKEEEILKMLIMIRHPKKNTQDMYYSEYLELRRENKHTNEVQSIGVLYAVNEKITALFLKNKAVIFCSF